MGAILLPPVVSSQTATTSDVAASVTSVVILAANSNRKGGTVVNDGTARLCLRCGGTASLTSFTVRLDPNAYWEVPFGYDGIIEGIWTAASGFARVTEFT